MLETLNSYQKQVIREIEAELAYQQKMWVEAHDLNHSDNEWENILANLVEKERQFRHKMIKIAATAISAAVANDKRYHGR